MKLYWIPEKTRADKENNRYTMQLAEAIKAKRIVDIQNKEFGFNDNFKFETNFLDYYRAMCETRHGEETRGNWGNWYSCLKYLEQYCNPKMTFKDVTPEFVKGFREHLDKTARVRDKRKTITTTSTTKPISQNTKQSYFNKFVLASTRHSRRGLSHSTHCVVLRGSSLASPSAHTLPLTR